MLFAEGSVELDSEIVEELVISDSVNINGDKAIITRKAKFLTTILVSEEVLLICVDLTSKKVNFHLVKSGVLQSQ